MNYLLTGQQSERLEYRIVDYSYFDLWLEFFEHPDSARFLGLQALPSPLEQCREWFRRVEERYKKDRGGMNALIDKASGEFVGQAGLLVQQVDDLEELEVGYSVLPRFWNKGYATEAAIRCRDFAFQNSFTESLISIIDVQNIRSEKVAIKNGMVNTRVTDFRGMKVNIFRIEKSSWEKVMQLSGGIL